LLPLFEREPDCSQNAIELDRELRSGTIEIEYVWVQRMLSAEFVACEVSVP
jgi:hypothetical protein